MPEFGKRLRDTLVMHFGDGSTGRLAKIAGCTRLTARKWLHKDEAHVDAKRLATVCDALGVRMTWLITGQGNPTSVRKLSSNEMRLLQIALKMPPARLDEWLKRGEEKLVRTKP